MARRALLLAILTAFAVELAALRQSQRGQSVSYDEPELLYSGLRAWTRGDLSVSPHPPLTKLLGALPVWLVLGPQLPPDARDAPGQPYRIHWADLIDYTRHLGAGDPRTAPRWPIRTAWEEGKQLLFDTPGTDATRMIGLARWGSLALWAVLIAAATGWSAWLHGTRGALLTALLAMSCPIGLAAGQVLTTDIGGAAFGTLGLWLYARALARPGRARFAAAGAAFGLALASRYQPLALLAACTAAAPFHAAFRGERLDLAGARRGAGLAALALLAAAGVLVCAYGGPSVVHFPASIAFLKGSITPGGGLPYFLDGQASREGWLDYFPRVLAYKLPPSHLAAVLLALASLLWRAPRRLEWLVLGPAGLLFALAVSSRINYGVRHVLPVLPALYVLAGRLLAPTPSGALPRRAWWVLILPLAGLVEQARTHPHYQPYASPLIGGSARGYLRMADGNVDAGQGLLFLREELASRPGGALLAYFGTGDPNHYGIPYRYLCGYFDEHRLGREPAAVPFPPRYLAVSATLLQLYGVDRTPGALHWLRPHPPDAMAGYSILLWDLESRPRWLGPLAGVYLDRSLSQHLEDAQRVELRARAARLLRTLRERDPGGLAEAEAWLASRTAAFAASGRPATRLDLAVLFALALDEAGWDEPARAAFQALRDGRWGALPRPLDAFLRDRLARPRER